VSRSQKVLISSEKEFKDRHRKDLTGTALLMESKPKTKQNAFSRKEKRGQAQEKCHVGDPKTSNFY
jgi:hypothetical protein